ncbi:MAG TPA: dihydrodipicolinate reductase [Acidimicrobiia bacterium]|jgi:hypothetical protein
MVWGSGEVAAAAIGAIAERADLELVGVWVHSPDKDGRDAGLLRGGSPIGVAASTNADALLALGPDCVCYAATNPHADTDYVRFLEAGINVVTVSTGALVYPPHYLAAGRDSLVAAAEAGRATLYASGLEPGFAGDQFLLTLLTLSKNVRSVRTQKVFSYAGYAPEHMIREVFGFGQPLDHTPLLATPGALAATWGSPVRMVADAMGVELEDIHECYDRAVAPRRLEVACGVIEAGTVGAVRLATIGVVDGHDAIVIEHVNRMATDLAPEWPSAELDGTYRLMVEGEPDLRCDLAVGTPETFGPSFSLATAMRVVNAIPAVCHASPGLVSSLDLPLTLPGHGFS